MNDVCMKDNLKLLLASDQASITKFILHIIYPTQLNSILFSSYPSFSPFYLSFLIITSFSPLPSTVCYSLFSLYPPLLFFFSLTLLSFSFFISLDPHLLVLHFFFTSLSRLLPIWFRFDRFHGDHGPDSHVRCRTYDGSTCD